MIYLRKFNSWHFLTIQESSIFLNSLTPYQFAQFSSSFWRPFSFSAQFHKESDEMAARCTKVSAICGVRGRVGPQVSIGLFSRLEPMIYWLHGRRNFTSNSEAPLQEESDSVTKKIAKKPLRVFFQEAVGLIEKSEQSESEDETENKELKCKLRKLEEEVRILREKRKNEKSRNGNGVLENEGKSKKLHELFMNEEVKSVKSRKSTPLSMEDHTVYKELSPDMVMFVTHLYNEGYFKDSNFLPRKRFDITCFENSYARDFVKCAAEQFGRDHQEIAKWLSGSDLKKVALFGCPSIAKKTVFSAKRLRAYFRIQEDNVCGKCALKASCKFVNQNVRKGDMTNLHLPVVMRVITLYALESVPPQLVMPDEIKASVSRLLMDILRLSQTVS